jgi:hypothetical protein
VDSGGADLIEGCREIAERESGRKKGKVENRGRGMGGREKRGRKHRGSRE